MAWPKGVPRVKKIEPAPVAVADPVAEVPPAPVPEPVAPPPLAQWLEDMEALHIASGVVLVRASHPDATDGLHTGRYSGVTLTRGPLAAVWSDGSTLSAL